VRGKNLIRFFIVVLIFSGFSSLALAQEWVKILERIYPLGSPPGYEHRLINEIKSFLDSRWLIQTDNLGSLIALSGEKIDYLMASPVDEIGYFVSGLTADGFIRIDRAINPPYRLFDNHLMGRAVIIWTKKGPVQGIVAQPAVHILTREKREQLEKGVTLDDIFIDIGVRSEAEVRARGVEMLDAVTRERKLTFLGSRRLCGLALADKLFPSLLISAALKVQALKKTDGLSLAWVAQTRVNARGVKGAQSLGLVNLKNRLEPKRTIILTGWPADEAGGEPKLGHGPLLAIGESRPSALAESFIRLASAEKINLQILPGRESPLLRPFQGQGNEAIILGVAIRDVATPAEAVSLDDINSLLKLINLWLERRPK